MTPKFFDTHQQEVGGGGVSMPSPLGSWQVCDRFDQKSAAGEFSVPARAVS